MGTKRLSRWALSVALYSLATAGFVFGGGSAGALQLNGQTSDDDHWWTGFGDATQRGLGQPVNALVVYNDTLVAGGEFFRTPGNSVAKWDGENWGPLGGGVVRGYLCSGFPDCLFYVADAVVFRGDLIVAGKFRYAGDYTFGDPPELRASNIARWDGHTWHALGSGLNNIVYRLFVFNDELIASGLFTEAGGQPIPYIARWNGASWRGMGELNGPPVAYVDYHGELVASGDFSQAGGLPAPSIASWNGSGWAPFGVQETYGRGLIVYHDSLIATIVHMIDGVQRVLVSRWDGTTWHPLGDGLASDIGSVLAFAIYNNELIAGGYLGNSLNPLNNIARWNGASWDPLGSGTSPGRGENGGVRALAVHKGHLFVGGAFTAAGDKPSWFIARWDDVITPVEVEALEAIASETHTRIRWRLASSSVSAIRGIAVERAGDALGPYEPCTADMLPPQRDMMFDDLGAGRSRAHWYRLRVVHASGQETIAGPVQAAEEESSPVTILYPPVEPQGGGPIPIRYRTASRSPAQLRIFSATGRLVRVLDPFGSEPGEGIQYWDRRAGNGSSVSRGVYFVQLTTDHPGPVQRLTLLHRESANQSR